MMAACCLAVLVSFAGQAASANSALPHTPQGRHVQAYLDAFNSGDEQKFLKAHEDHMTPDVLKKQPPEKISGLFKRMRGDFGTLAVEEVLEATAKQIRVAVPTKDGMRGIFTFTFEEASPHRISGINVNVS
jgi:hypothetical protein